MKDFSKPILTIDQLKEKLKTVKVGQIWKCIEDKRIVMISMVRPKEIDGYIWDQFSVMPYISFAPMDFVRYFDLKLDPRYNEHVWRDNHQGGISLPNYETNTKTKVNVEENGAITNITINTSKGIK